MPAAPANSNVQTPSCEWSRQTWPRTVALSPTTMIVLLCDMGEKLDPGAPQEENLYELDAARLAARGIGELTQSLAEAGAAFADDPFVETVLGKELRGEFIRYKSEEWRQYHQRISQWEIDQYARLF